MTIRLLPDAEALAVAYLKAHASITPLVGTRVSTVLPANPTFPYLQVILLAGVEKSVGHLDNCYLQVDAWGTTRDDANLLIRTARAVLLDAPYVTHDRGIVSYAETVSPPRWLLDTSVTPPRPRYSCDVSLTIHPHLL